MPKLRCFQLGSLNLKISPFLTKEGDLIRCVNMKRDQVGAYKKRSGYITYLGTANGSVPLDLFNWTKDDGTTLFNYRNSGGILYYSSQGTGAWTVCGNGTVTAGQHVGRAVLENTLMVGFTGGTPRYSTDGTSFTLVTAAPKEEFFTSKFNRIWAGGTSSNMYWCTAGTPSDWTADSSSIKVPGPGKLGPIWTCNDRVTAAKNSGIVFTYDDYNLRQVPTNQGPSSPYSLAEVEDYWFYLNRNGVFGFNGDRPKLLSNAVEKQIYNDSNTGIAGTSFNSAPGICHKYDYLLAVGTVKDDLTDEEVGNAILKYDYQLEEWGNYKFANFPSAWCSFKDANGDQQLIFGNSANVNGQCYTFGGTAVSDNGSAIEATMEGVLHFGKPERDKHFKTLGAFASPGCSAKVAVAIGDSFSKAKKKWMDIGDLNTGFKEFRFPSDSRGKLLFWRLYEYGKDSRFHFYGFVPDFDFIGD